MKKLIALLLGLMMAFSLVACGDTSGNTGGGGSGGGGGGNNPIVTPGEDYDPNDPNQYIYREVFADSPYKDQWDTSRLGQNSTVFGIVRFFPIQSPKNRQA